MSRITEKAAGISAVIRGVPKVLKVPKVLGVPKVLEVHKVLEVPKVFKNVLDCNPNPMFK
jgi:hypothetical protein